ncbi:hypothetical protein BaRGS_00018188 [Batillaria attramentaria]|uniref:Uncharacterized protein n=1 Tax=Batillaria attramentaria TaxID=370345 RepID=A0ABD0KUU8_9CAEN
MLLSTSPPRTIDNHEKSGSHGIHRAHQKLSKAHVLRSTLSLYHINFFCCPGFSAMVLTQTLAIFQRMVELDVSRTL